MVEVFFENSQHRWCSPLNVLSKDRLSSFAIASVEPTLIDATKFRRSDGCSNHATKRVRTPKTTNPPALSHKVSVDPTLLKCKEKPSKFTVNQENRF